MKYLNLLFLLLNINLINANKEEKSLRTLLFDDYNKLVRPVNNYHDILNVSMGIGVQNLEAFNQKEETIDINLWVRLNWNDAYLNWTTDTSNLTFLSVDKSYTWVPDIELLNAASLPDIYTLKGGMNLYNNGDIMWSNPAIFRFSCGLQLKYFPFDTQECKMKFSSWVYNNNLLYLKPYDDVSKQIDILDSFSHSEWEIENVNVLTYDETRPCCPKTTFSVNEYTIILKRYPHYYNISMGMTISLVIVNFIIMLINPNNISRTSTAVFIPLTILALQLTLADKIPIVGYYTLMDYFFLSCFITSMVCSIESALVFALITSKSKIIYLLFKNRFNLEKLIKHDKQNKNNIKNKLKKHNNLTNELNELNPKSELSELSELNELNPKSELNATIELNELNETSETDIDIEFNNITNILKNVIGNDSMNSDEVKIIDNDNSSDIIKTINYDDITLNLTYKEILIFREIEKYVIYFDNGCRIIFPLIFFIIIGIIFRHK
jgi:hypothetical protein